MAKRFPKTSPDDPPQTTQTESSASTTPTSSLRHRPDLDADAVEAELKDPPEVKAMAFCRTKGGYAVILLTIQGWAVVDRELLTDGVVPRHHAENVFKVESAQRILWPEAFDDLERN
jgi:hypothetical protein